jgi:hypothetical protein
MQLLSLQKAHLAQPVHQLTQLWMLLQVQQWLVHLLLGLLVSLHLTCVHLQLLKDQQVAPL